MHKFGACSLLSDRDRVETAQMEGSISGKTSLSTRMEGGKGRAKGPAELTGSGAGPQACSPRAGPARPHAGLGWAGAVLRLGCTGAVLGWCCTGLVLCWGSGSSPCSQPAWWLRSWRRGGSAGASNHLPDAPLPLRSWDEYLCVCSFVTSAEHSWCQLQEHQPVQRQIAAPSCAPVQRPQSRTHEALSRDSLFKVFISILIQIQGVGAWLGHLSLHCSWGLRKLTDAVRNGL